MVYESIVCIVVSEMCIRDSFYSFVFFFKLKTAYELRISDWSSDVCSSDLFRMGPAWISVEAVPEHGMATIWDADVLIWAASQIIEARDAGRPTDRKSVV